MNVDKNGSRPRLYVSLKDMIFESPNSSTADNSSVAANLSGAMNIVGSASSIIDEDHCQPPMDNDIYEDHIYENHCEPLMDNDYPGNVHGDDLKNQSSSNHNYVDGTSFKSGDTFKVKCTLVEALSLVALKTHFNFYAWKSKSDKYSLDASASKKRFLTSPNDFSACKAYAVN
ncbi:hypothetical protein RND71_041754 [Anisodus tanguticus]|uniref:Uncharacterized protein n=1 Tax=Anisodus tanguticus TaxID=243964 RepID=A0AAE1QYC0_9SOLA|nr:hypothetical protein RND71_041754 [Anisodus tanguticus]